MYLPGQPVSEVKVMRSSLCACWTPASFRFSRMTEAKSGVPAMPDLPLSSEIFQPSMSSSFSSDGEDAMGRDAFDGERAGDAHLGFVVVGFVVEEFKLGLGGDGGVNLLLAGDAGFPPGGVQFLNLGCSRGVVGLTFPEGWSGLRPLLRSSGGVARDFPFLPVLLERLVQLLAQRFERLLPLAPR